MIKLKSLLAGLLLGAFFIGPTCAQTGQLPANTALGSITGGPPIALSKSQTTTLINPFSSALSGAVPASGGGTVDFLRADGSWVAVSPGSGVPAGASGNVQFNNAGSFGGLTNTQLTADINLATASLSGALPAWPNNTTTFFRGDGSYQTLNCAALSGVATSCGTDTTNANNITSGTLGAARGGTGVDNSTNTTNDILASNGTNGNFVHTAILTLLNTVCGLAPNTCTALFGYAKASWWGAVCDGTTDDSTALQTFLTQIATNGVNGASVTGYFPPGNCYTNSASSLTLTINSSTNVVQYHLIGYGSTITTDPSQAVIGLYVKRGTLSTYQDEQTSVTVEGLTINHRNNANALYGIKFDMPHTTLLRNQIFAGDSTGTHNQASYAGIFGMQANSTDTTTGPFWSRVIGNVIKGTSTAGDIPECMEFDGDVNALNISGNTCNEATYFIRISNACSSVTSDCAAWPNGVVVTENAIESVVNGIVFRSTVPSLSSIAGWMIYGNRLENITTLFLDISTTVVQSTYPLVLGPNIIISTANYVFNAATPIAVDIRDQYVGQATINAGPLAGNTTAAPLGTLTITGALVGMYVDVTANADLQGIQLTGYVSATNTVLLRISNPTSGSIDLPSMSYRATVRYAY